MPEAATLGAARCLPHDTQIYDRMGRKLGHGYCLTLRFQCSQPSALTFMLPLRTNQDILLL